MFRLLSPSLPSLDRRVHGCSTRASAIRWSRMATALAVLFGSQECAAPRASRASALKLSLC
eukprot:6174200-Pleurochrysis_carterae.AAC.6